MKTKIVVIGSEGMLGNECVSYFKSKFCDVYEFDVHNNIDITDYDSTFNELKDLVEDVGADNQWYVVNCAAITDNNAPFDRMMDVNYKGVVNLKKICTELKLKLIHISTDYVFDITPNGKYVDFEEIEEHEFPFLVDTEEEIDPFNNTFPQQYSSYSWSKLMAERELLCHVNLFECDARVVRVAWLYGFRKERLKENQRIGAPSFVTSMLNILKNGKQKLNIVNDQYGNPTSTKEAARLIYEVVIHWDDAPVVVNASCDGICSWCTFAKEIFKLARWYGMYQSYKLNDDDIEVVATTTEEYNDNLKKSGKDVIVRPKWTPLHKGFFHKKRIHVQHWKEALDAYMKELTND